MSRTSEERMAVSPKSAYIKRIYAIMYKVTVLFGPKGQLRRFFFLSSDNQKNKILPTIAQNFNSVSYRSILSVSHSNCP